MKKAIWIILIIILMVGWVGFIGNATDSAQPIPTASYTPSYVSYVTQSHNLENSHITATNQPKCVVQSGYEVGTVNFRKGAGMSFGVIEVLHENDILDNLGQEKDGWKYVRHLNRKGWILSIYVVCDK